MTVRGTVRSRHRSDRSRASPTAPAKKSKSQDLDFFICAARHNIVCVLARNIISSNARTSFLIRAAQMNEVALRANDVLRNDVGSPNDVALRANGHASRRDLLRTPPLALPAILWYKEKN